MNTLESTDKYKESIKGSLDNTLTNTELVAKSKKTGRVRDQYDLGEKLALITTDRQSFDGL